MKAKRKNSAAPGRRGGQARKKALTPELRKQIATKASRAAVRKRIEEGRMQYQLELTPDEEELLQELAGGRALSPSRAATEIVRRVLADELFRQVIRERMRSGGHLTEEEFDREMERILGQP